jgi:hypothetical protein
VDETNDYWDNYTEDNLTASGFRRDGNYFVKDIVTGSTITSPVVRELRKIQEYQNMIYETPDLETASGIRSYGLAYDFDAIQALIANATQVVEAEEERVFGTECRNGDPRAEPGLSWRKLRTSAKSQYAKKAGRTRVMASLASMWVMLRSTSPVMIWTCPRAGARTSSTGSGELGRIMGLLNWYNMEESAGYSKVNMPAWDKPLWDPIPF